MHRHTWFASLRSADYNGKQYVGSYLCSVEEKMSTSVGVASTGYLISGLKTDDRLIDTYLTRLVHTLDFLADPSTCTYVCEVRCK